MIDILVKGGRVVDSGGVQEADLAIQDGKVAGLAQRGLISEANRTIEAEGKLVLPGVVDSHFHCRNRMAVPLVDDMLTGTRSAAYGGVTTVIAYVWGPSGEPFAQAIETFKEEAAGKAMTDFAIHCGLRPEMELLRGIPQVLDLGVYSFKFQMDYRRTGDGRMLDPDHLVAGMDIVAQAGGMAIVHPEDGFLIDYLEERSIEGGKTGPGDFLLTRPALAEAMSARQVIRLSQVLNCPLYLVHLTCRESLAELVEGRERDAKLGAETQIQYLLLTDEVLHNRGPLGKIGPPLRSGEDHDALWDAVSKGIIETISSDHAPYLEQVKQAGDNIFDVPFGMPGVETLLPLTYWEGVAKGRISLTKMVEALAESPARRFGLYPRKGNLQRGADADVVIFDPDEEWTISAAGLHTAADFTPYQGWRIKGRVTGVLLRGEALLEDGKLAKTPGVGQFLPQQPLT
jgi:dihydropyrimidinase